MSMPTPKEDVLRSDDAEAAPSQPVGIMSVLSLGTSDALSHRPTRDALARRPPVRLAQRSKEHGEKVSRSDQKKRDKRKATKTARRKQRG